VVIRDMRNDILIPKTKKFPAADRLTSDNNANPASIKYVQDSLESVIDAINQNVLIFFQNKRQAESFTFL